MNSRERIILTLNHKEPDRVPIDIGGTHATTMHINVYKKLKKKLGVVEETEDEILQYTLQTAVISERMLKKLNGDVVLITTNTLNNYNKNISLENNSYVDEWGIEYRLPNNGLYFDIVGHPLKNISFQSLEKYNWPDPYDKRRFKDVKDKAKYYYKDTDYAIAVLKEKDFLGGILQDCAWLVGFEEFFCLLATDEELANKLMDKVLDFHMGFWEAILSRVENYIQVAIISDDLGTQDNLIISPGMYRKFIKPRHKKLVELIKSKSDAKVLLHSCGAVREIINDMIEIGIDMLNPIQLSAKKLGDTKLLKEEFGEKIVFWGGGCDTQEILPLGKPSDVEREVERRIRDLKPGGGFVFAPVHNIQPDVPIENVLTLYKSALKFGKY